MRGTLARTAISHRLLYMMPIVLILRLFCANKRIDMELLSLTDRLKMQEVAFFALPVTILI